MKATPPGSPTATVPGTNAPKQPDSASRNVSSVGVPPRQQPPTNPAATLRPYTRSISPAISAPPGRPGPVAVPDTKKTNNVLASPQQPGPSSGLVQQSSSSPPATDTILGVAYLVNGTALLPYDGVRRTAFEGALTSLLKSESLAGGSLFVNNTPILTYRGLLLHVNGSSSGGGQRRRTLLADNPVGQSSPSSSGATQVDGVTVYYDIGNVDAGAVPQAASALDQSAAVNGFRQLLIARGIDVSNLALVATSAGGIEVPRGSGTTSSGLSGGSIAGIVIGAIIAVLLVLLLVLLLIRRRRNEDRRVRYITPAAPVSVASSRPYGFRTGGSTAPASSASHSSPGTYTASLAAPLASGSTRTPPDDSSSDGGGQYVNPLNPGRHATSWWDERMRGQDASYFGGGQAGGNIQLGDPGGNFDPFSANIAEATYQGRSR